MTNKINAERKPRVIVKHIKQSALFTVALSRDIIFEYVKVFCIFHWIWQKVPKLRAIVSKRTLPIWESVRFGLLKKTRISHVVFCDWLLEEIVQVGRIFKTMEAFVHFNG